jgi:putative FmdB family regulatory protein
MPIYEYRCTACGFQSEYLRKVTDPALAVCPECGQDAFRKLPTAAGFQLKGSGWYATDFKHAGAKPAGTNPDAAAKDGADTKKKDADAKPDGDAKPVGTKEGATAPAGGTGGTSTS